MAKPTLDLSDAEFERLRKQSVHFRLSPKVLSFEDFEHFVFYVRRLVGEVSYAVTRHYGGWILTDLSYGSAGVAAAPAELDEAQRVESTIVSGLRSLQAGEDIPDYYSDRALRYARLIVRLARDKEVIVCAPDAPEVVLRAPAVEKISSLLVGKSRYYGSVVGDLDAVSVHRGTRVTIYGDNGRVIASRLSDSLLSDVKELLGQRVIAIGEISANRSGGIVSLRAEQIFSSPKPQRLPTVSALYGAVPDISSGLSSAQYIRSLWGDE
jgi:hypothetical protein